MLGSREGDKTQVRQSIKRSGGVKLALNMKLPQTAKLTPHPKNKCSLNSAFPEQRTQSGGIERPHLLMQSLDGQKGEALAKSEQRRKSEKEVFDPLHRACFDQRDDGITTSRTHNPPPITRNCVSYHRLFWQTYHLRTQRTREI
ncbi:unnamed protein product [Arabidopsis thaliana]|uniref:Uncharacterized protein n=1 Tax=Arabidopsis thaliana TaxID=3702 RepID=A0A5S9XRJ9_ARATH|nr:unnamed protein product [Arabidopsis thaliana]